MFCGDLAERPDHAGDGEQTAVTGHDAQEIAGEASDPCLVGDRRDGLGLILAALLLAALYMALAKRDT